MGRTIGIDLGTTNSCACVVVDGERIVIPNAEGSRTTPSVVAFTEDGQQIVGQVAKRQAQTNSENTIYAVKRLIGRRFDAPDVEQAKRSSPFHIVEGPSGDAWVQVRDKELSPAEISALILREMRDIAEDHLGEEVTDAIVTVPAYFNDSQRQATKDAGRIAGLNVQRIVNEPTAAALAYGLANQDKGAAVKKVAVYDLGGGTFDISILELQKGLFSVLSTSGDTYLGGEDFDTVIIDWLADQFEDAHGVDLREVPMALQRLKEEAEQAKCELSSTDEVELSLPFIHTNDDGPLHLETTLSREKLENLVDYLIERSLDPCRTALKDANLRREDVDVVLLVGGMTRMPRVRELVSEFFEKEVDTSVNPDEVVAMGAAIQGGIVRGELTDVLLLDVAPLTLGVQTAGGVFTPLIHRNTTVPCSHSEVFSTAKDNQSMVRIHVLQGERAMAEDNKSLAVFELTGIPPAPRGVPKIGVTFKIDENGIVSVTALDEGTGQEQSVNIVADGGLSEEDINRIIEEGKAREEEDQTTRELMELRNQAEGLLYSTDRSLREFGEYLDPQDAEDLAGDIVTIKELISDATFEELETIMATLQDGAYRLADAMYNEMEEPPPAQEPAAED